jgi:hypothetical protein
MTELSVVPKAKILSRREAPDASEVGADTPAQLHAPGQVSVSAPPVVFLRAKKI